MKNMLVGCVSSLVLLACTTEEGLNDSAQMGIEATPTVNAQEGVNRKNVVFILIDDLGYSDIGAYNPDTFYNTPNIDALAKTGVRFTNGYAANPVCSPSRAAIMVGKHPTRLQATDWFHPEGVPHRVERFLPADMVEHLPLEEITLAEVFKQNGYRTAFLGKWHLGEDEVYWPENQGFEVNIGGFYKGQPPGGYFSPYENPRLEDGPDGEYLTGRLTDEAVKLIRSYSDQDDPFFMFMSYYTVHTPLQAPQSLIEKYISGTTGDGFSDFEDEDQYFVSEPAPRKVRVRQNHATYAAMVESMDSGVGRILKALDEAGLANDTIIVFTSDNGGLSTAEGSPTSNLPLRGGKGWLYEGGIRVPFIVKVPGVTTSGIVSDTPVSGLDFMKTLASLTSVSSEVQSYEDGIDFSELLLTGSDIEKERVMVWHYPHYSNQGGFPGAAIRKGDMKLLQNFETGEVALYNLSLDIQEKNNLAQDMPEKVVDMRSELFAWYEETDARFLSPIEGHEELPWMPEK